MAAPLTVRKYYLRSEPSAKFASLLTLYTSGVGFLNVFMSLQQGKKGKGNGEYL